MPRCRLALHSSRVAEVPWAPLADHRCSAVGVLGFVKLPLGEGAPSHSTLPSALGGPAGTALSLCQGFSDAAHTDPFFFCPH